MGVGIAILNGIVRVDITEKVVSEGRLEVKLHSSIVTAQGPAVEERCGGGGQGTQGRQLTGLGSSPSCIFLAVKL